MSEDAKMLSGKSREPRIIYIAASARELPSEVQAWLGRPEHRATSSPHVYDALAVLASGARPAVMIVSMDAVDWSEMEFFDQVARLCRETHIYVVGHDHHSDKLEAACRHGAMPWDEELLRESLTRTGPWSRGPGVSDLLAATLRQASAPKTPPPMPLRPVPVEPEEPEFPGEESPPEPEAESQPAVAAEIEPVAETPPVRLIGPAETEVEEEPVEEETQQPIPFPWAPSSKRPQRTPPKVRPTAIEPPPAAPAESCPALPPSPAPPAPRQPVELTAEELAALMGRPIAPEKPAREGTG